MKINKPKFILMMGLPASGKSTWIKQNGKKYVVVELDWIRRDVFGHQFHRNAEPFIIGIAKSMVRMLLEQGKDIILDSTCLPEFIRSEWIKLGMEYDAKITVVHINTDPRICIKRDMKRGKKKVGRVVIENLLNTYQAINKVYYKELGIIVKEIDNL